MNLNKDYGVARRRINFTSGGSDENDETNGLGFAEKVSNVFAITKSVWPSPWLKAIYFARS